MPWTSRLSARIKKLKEQTLTLYFAIRHPWTPWPAKLLGAIVVGYAFSPIDLIPDFIPVLGMLDDLLLLPLGVFLVYRLIPASILEECRTQAQSALIKPSSKIAGIIIVSIWIVLILLVVWTIVIKLVKTK